MTGYCSCDSPILEFAGNFFIKGVYQAALILEKVLCPALQALDIVMAVGMAAIPSPGKAITGGRVSIGIPYSFSQKLMRQLLLLDQQKRISTHKRHKTLPKNGQISFSEDSISHHKQDVPH
jgi:hypothetical protein